ncbi:hypothetical protein [Umezawaea sp.]|uniref:hypothetical protein n=1 Tax=Umezawaea sp. TaxID=1955258 RepID=UPI002ED6298E
MGDEVHPPHDRPPSSLLSSLSLSSSSERVPAGTWTPARAHPRTAGVPEVLDARFALGDPVGVLGWNTPTQARRLRLHHPAPRPVAAPIPEGRP